MKTNILLLFISSIILILFNTKIYNNSYNKKKQGRKNKIKIKKNKNKKNKMFFVFKTLY